MAEIDAKMGEMVTFNQTHTYCKARFHLAVCLEYSVVYIMGDVYTTVRDVWGHYNDSRRRTITVTVDCKQKLDKVDEYLRSVVSSMVHDIQKRDMPPIFEGPMPKF